MESAKIKALLYADIFDYPLTGQELKKWEIAEKQPIITDYQLLATGKGGYYCFKGREGIITLRKNRQKISLSKIKKAKLAINILKKIPFIKMVAITGGLAMLNTKKNDDIDLLIVTSKGALWLTRLLTTILLDLKGLRRKPNDKKITDKICLNMFLEDGSLTLPRQEQDLYGAHEVCQVKPIFDKKNAYQRFLMANLWARKFLPKAIDTRTLRYRDTKQVEKKSPNILISQLLNIFEWLSKLLQLIYMKRHLTTEVITSHMLRFHPKDYRHLVLKQYYDRLRKYADKKI